MTDLVERLREEVDRLSYNSLSHGCAACGVATNLADEAATALEAQRDFMKELSDALISVRPLGGSELFVKRFDEYFADPAYCKAAIEERSNDCHEAQKGLIRNR